MSLRHYALPLRNLVCREELDEWFERVSRTGERTIVHIHFECIRISPDEAGELPTSPHPWQNPAEVSTESAKRHHHLEVRQDDQWYKVVAAKADQVDGHKRTAEAAALAAVAEETDGCGFSRVAVGEDDITSYSVTGATSASEENEPELSSQDSSTGLFAENLKDKSVALACMIYAQKHPDGSLRVVIRNENPSSRHLFLGRVPQQKDTGALDGAEVAMVERTTSGVEAALGDEDLWWDLRLVNPNDANAGIILSSGAGVLAPSLKSSGGSTYQLVLAGQDAPNPQFRYVQI